MQNIKEGSGRGHGAVWITVSQERWGKVHYSGSIFILRNAPGFCEVSLKMQAWSISMHNTYRFRPRTQNGVHNYLDITIKRVSFTK